MPFYNQYFFQYAQSDLMVKIISLHNQISFYIFGILIGVLCIFGIIIKNYFDLTFPNVPMLSFTKNNILSLNIATLHGVILEIIWTILPTIILLMIALPSFQLLYEQDSHTKSTIDYYTVKVIGHQWYWSYETPLNNYVSYDSYMVPFSQLKLGDNRLLEVDNPLYLPKNTKIRFLVTSTDVLHSFAVPSLGIKVDAVPGRLNQVSCKTLNRVSTIYGQCSEICGVNHGFMPINIKIVSFSSILPENRFRILKKI